MINRPSQTQQRYQHCQEPSYESLGMALPPHRALKEFRSDKYYRAKTKKYEGLCYTPRNEKMVFEDFSRLHGTMVMVKHSPPHFRHLVRKNQYDFFILRNAQEFTLEAISLIEKIYQQKKRKIPPISIVGELDTVGWEMVYLLQERMPLTVGEGKMKGDTEHIKTGLEALLRSGRGVGYDAKQV